MLLLTFCFGFSFLNAQKVSVKAKIDTNNVLIGDQLHLKLEFQSDTKTKVIWPQMPDSIGAIEVISRSRIDTTTANGQYGLSQTLTITSFDSGYYTLPAFTFIYGKDPAKDSLVALTNPIFLNFKTVQVDTSKAFKDIKPIIEEPVTFDEYLVYFLIFLGILGLAIGVYFLWKKYKNRDKIKLEYDPKIPAYIIALESLKQLDSEKLWQKGLIKLYYIRITEILRLYIERQFSVPALEMISDEILDSMNKIRINSSAVQSLEKVLKVADMVKFAKMQPLPDEIAQSMTNSVNFVELSKPLIETAETESKEAQQ
jgi:hypothetical protein